MGQQTRRHVLRAGGALSVGTLAGCVLDGAETTEQPTDATVESLTTWERPRNCEHDSVIAVARVTAELDGGFDPINFARLSASEQSILETVTETGGYQRCGVKRTDGFSRFFDRIRRHTERQRGDRSRLYLERDGVYYGLYVEVLDQVYAH